MNPRDIMTDAIHNFHPQYQQYTQYSSGKENDDGIKGFNIKICLSPIQKAIQIYFPPENGKTKKKVS